MQDLPAHQPSVKFGFARGGLFSVSQVLGWTAVLFNACVARNCHDSMHGDQIGVGFVFVLALGAAVAVAGLTGTGLGVLSAVSVWKSTKLRWVGIALALLALASALAAGDAVNDSMCQYNGGASCQRDGR